jgi:arabinose-5-phosphate isomerase
MNHPAGAIGRALVMKVTDIMRTENRLALLAPEATIMDAAMAMTKAQSGCAIVVDGDRKLLGVFTDGDFRRAVEKCLNDDDRNDGSSNRKIDRSLVAEFMTPSPQFVYDNVFAAELL